MEAWRRFTLPRNTFAQEMNASDVMRAALRLLEHEEKKLEALRAIIDAGDASPESEDLDGEKVFSRLRRKTGSKSRRG
jgi:Arc/MetJ-type ribon-helix-helix transcriptional regulator